MGSTYNWENSSGSWSASGVWGEGSGAYYPTYWWRNIDTTLISFANPVINQGTIGYNSDRFYLNVQYTSPPGGFSGGRVTVTVYPQIKVTGTDTAVSCNGESNGAINLNVSGGLAPYTYLWSNGATTQDVSGLSAGTYTVTVTDSRGCTNVNTYKRGQVGDYYYPNNITYALDNTNGAKATFTITEPSAPLSATTAVTTPSCYGGNNGTATITATGGTPPYTYQWSNGVVTADNQSLSAGVYYFTVTDYNSIASRPRCTYVDSVVITQPDSMTVTGVVTDVIRGGDSCSGAIDVTVTGGTSPYTYLWDNAGLTNTQDLSNACEGDNTITVTDANGCVKSATFNVGVDDSFTLGYTKTNTRCTLPAGTIRVWPLGGGTNYTYLWSDGVTTQNRSGLAAGIYGVTCTDNFGSTATATITIE